MKRFLLAIASLLCPVMVHAASLVPVYVSILPQKYFVERIGGEHVDVSVMVMPGASPATYEPGPRQMVGLTKARAYFAIGVPFEQGWLSRIASANPDMTIISVDRGIEKQPIAERHHHGRDDNAGLGEALDPHVWLSPALARILAANTCAGLVQVDSVNEKEYEANLQVLLNEMDELDKDISARLTSVPKSRRSFLVFHPSWGYFARQYGLKQISIESEGKAPSPRELVEIVEHGRELGVSVVFVQPQFSDKSARVIASEIGARVVPLDPLAEDWAENLRRAAAAFQKELR